MGKKMYIGVDGKARKVKKVYVGVDNKARKVKKMYMGIDGKAKCIFSSDLDYYGTVSDGLSEGKYGLAATTVGGYAIFAGGMAGQIGTQETNTVDAYNASLTKTVATPFMLKKSFFNATTVGNYGLFAGGDNIYVEAYNTSLTKSLAENGLSVKRTNLGADTIGNYAIFIGGYGSTGANVAVDVYNASLTKVTISSLDNNKNMDDVASAVVGNYAIFAGGYNDVEAYNSSLVRQSLSLDNFTIRKMATTVGGYAIFAGGNYSDSFSSMAEAFNSSLTKVAVPNLRVKATQGAAGTLKNYAFFAGGWQTVDYTQNDVTAYDASLTRIDNVKNLSSGKYLMASATIGDYILFAGGKRYVKSGYPGLSSIDAYVA